MGKRHEERREEIIRSALELAAEVGVKKVTTQAIADRVGIAQPTVFRHFRTRDEIFAGAIAWLADRLFAVLDASLGARLPADEKLERLIRTQLAFVARHRGLPRMLFSDRLHLESPTLKKTVQKIMGHYTARVAGVIREGIRSGRLQPEMEADAAARFVAATVQGLIMRWSVFDFEFSLEAEAEALIRFLLQALGRNES